MQKPCNCGSSVRSDGYKSTCEQCGQSWSSNYRPKEYIVIYSDLGDEELNKEGPFPTKEAAEEYIDSIDNKCWLVGGVNLEDCSHT